MEPLLLTAVLGGLALLYSIYRLLTRPSISDIPGPESQSFWLGMSFSPSIPLAWPSFGPRV